MTFRPLLCLTTMAIIIAAVGCKTKLADLEGTTWRVDQITTADGTTMKPKADYTLSLKDNRIMLHLDVNKCRMNYDIVDKNRINVSPGACTRMCCDKPEGEAVAAKLAGTFDIEMGDEMQSLILRGQDVITLTPSASIADDATTDKNNVLILEKGGCFGACAAYKMELRQDGEAEYHGRDHVEHMGHATQTLDKAQVSRFFILAQTVNWHELEAEYDDKNLPDLQTTNITYNDKAVRVRWSPNAPDELNHLIDQLHEFAMSQTWIVDKGQ